MGAIVSGETLGYSVKKLFPSVEVLNRLVVASDAIEIEECQWNMYPVGDTFHTDTEVVIQNIEGWKLTFCLKDPKSKSIRIITHRGLKLFHIPQDVNDKKKVRLVESFASAFPDYSQPAYDSPGNIQEKIDGSLAPSKVKYY